MKMTKANFWYWSDETTTNESNNNENKEHKILRR